MGLSFMLYYLKLVTSLRIQNVQIRRGDRRRRREERNEKIIQEQTRVEKKEADIKEYMTNLEEGVQFNEDEFNEEWIQLNPEIEIPPEVENEVDIDFEGDEN